MKTTPTHLVRTTRNLAILAVFLVVSASPRPMAGDELKLSRVALFSSGVGYFQIDGTVEGEAAAELRFRTAQINDLIKSLVLQDFDGGTIRAVQYPSRDPIEKTLRSFGVDITGKPTLGQLLDQLRGVEVEVTAPQAATGMIVAVEKQKIDAGDGKVVEIDVLTLMTPAGLRSFRLPEVAGVKIKDEKVEAELRKALETLATSHDADKKTVTLNFTGHGRRRVRAGYILEAPIWKTSYRLVLADDKKPYLQGWATVENTTEEDWEGVRLSLVSGRPISFIMDLYTPLYVPRPREELELYASLRPPTHEGAMDEARERTAGRKRAAVPAMPGLEIDAKSLGVASARGEAAGLSGSAVTGQGIESVAAAERAGELFSYEIQSPVSLKRQQSAMLPIVTAEIDGSRLSIYNPAYHAKHPLNAVRITNTTGLNLMQGPVTVFDGASYAGDARLPDLRPDENRLVSYALDLAVEVEPVALPKPTEVVRLRVRKGTLHLRHKSVDERTYHVKNKSDRPRTVLIEQPYPPGWTLVEPKEPFERAAGLYRFKVDVEPLRTASLAVKQEYHHDETVILTSAGLDQIGLYIRAAAISPGVKNALEQVVARRMAIDDVVRQRREAERQIETIEQEQARIRENMKTVPSNSDLARRYISKLDAQETRMEQLRARVDDFSAREQDLIQDLEKFLATLDAE